MMYFYMYVPAVLLLDFLPVMNTSPSSHLSLYILSSTLVTSEKAGALFKKLKIMREDMQGNRQREG